MLYRRLIEQHLNDERPLLYIEGNGITCKEIDTICRNILDYFKTKGIYAGKKILLVGECSRELLLLMFACIAGGITFIILEENTEKEKYEYINRDCMPDAVYLAKTNSITFNTGRKAGEQVCVKHLLVRPDSLSKDQYLRWRRLIDPEQIVYLLYTSGSSGKAKGVIARISQVLFCIDAINKRLKNGKHDRIFSVLPLAFDYGLYQIFLALACGAQIYLKSHCKIQEILRELKKNQITAFPGLPSLFRMLLKTRLLERVDLRELRYITSTGEVFPVSMIKQLEQLLPNTFIVAMYGLTECKRVSIMPLDKKIQHEKCGSCGLPLDGVRVWLRNADPQSGVGELVVSGLNVMEGYWNDLKETRRYFDLREGQRILYTGDLFYIDQDRFLYFKGRKRQMLKIRGKRLSCVEIEQKLEQIPSVEECVVFPVLKDGEEKAGICIALDVNASPKEKDVWGTKIEKVCPEMKDYEIWIWEEKFPRNDHGKVDKVRIERECLGYDGEVFRE